MIRFVLNLFVIASTVQAARILGVFQFTSLSHQIVYQAIWRELSLRGHTVVVVTPHPIKDPTLVNLTEIDVSHIYDAIPAAAGIDTQMSKDAPTTTIMRAFFEISSILQEAIMKHEEFRKIYGNPNEHFDLILVESLHPGMYSLSGRFNAPIIGISSLGAIEATHYSIGNTIHPVLYPEMNLPHHSRLTIRQKIYSLYTTIWLIFDYNYNVIPAADKIARKYLGDDLPYLGDLGRNISMLFLNVNPLIYNVRPNIPTVISLGFVHIKPVKPLPQDLQTILDEATEGVVYISLGTNVKSINIADNLRQAIVGSIAELPYKVLWKWESDDFPGKPKNLVTRKWFPQQDLLAHPNVKAFVTQAGLQSLEEAITRGVPMVAMAFIGDQPMNAKKLVEAGVAVEVDPLTTSKDELKTAIIEVVQNEKYRNKIREVRDILYDQPMTGLERAVWWAEYVIRHKGTRHLRSPTADIPVYEYLLLDVMAVLLIGSLIIVYVLYKIVNTFISLVFRRYKIKKN